LNGLDQRHHLPFIVGRLRDRLTDDQLPSGPAAPIAMKMPSLGD
jgi:hypothetical protein